MRQVRRAKERKTMRKINPLLFIKITAALKRNYLLLGEAVTCSIVEKDESLSRWNPRTIERTMRVMAEREMIERPRKGFYKPKFTARLNFERISTLEDFQ